MDRRTFIAAAVVSSAIVRFATNANFAQAAEQTQADGWRRFEITTKVTLLNSSGRARLWLPLAQTAAGYQTAISLDWDGNGRTELLRDPTYGSLLLSSAWDASTPSQYLEVRQTVVTCDRSALPTVPMSAAERQFWLAPRESAPTDGIVRATVERIVAGRTTPRDRLRAIYDWVVDTTWRNPDTPGCGFGDIRAMLETENFGGKCADINGLMVGLARAAGIPARDVYGIRVAESRLYPSLGKSGDLSRAQHCRAEAYLEEDGWFPIDPADVRKVVLEQKLAVDSEEVRKLRERLFGSWEMNWVGYNSATDIELPRASQQRPNFAFLMYPVAFTTTGQLDALDPARFSYKITSKQL
jgi:transglutaminase-like putative cysteine protease